MQTIPVCIHVARVKQEAESEGVALYNLMTGDPTHPRTQSGRTASQ